jgi:hypothetical protein
MTTTMTLREWIEIHKDLDAYIANGGELLDLITPDLTMFDGPAGLLIGEGLGEATCMRLARFFTTIGERGSDEIVGDVLTEAEARELWRKAA